MRTEAIDERLKEEILSFARKYIASGIVGIVACFATTAMRVKENYGKHGEDLVMRSCHDVGAKIGNIWRERLNIADGDMKTLHYVLAGMAKEIGMENRLIELSDNAMTIRIVFCPYAKGWKIAGATGDICGLWGAFISGVCGAINPAVEFKYTESILKGSPYCEMVYELRSQGTSGGERCL